MLSRGWVHKYTLLQREEHHLDWQSCCWLAVQEPILAILMVTHIASSGGLSDKDMVKLLLRKGANKEICNHLGKAAYDVAAESGHTILFDVLRLGDKLCKATHKGEERAINWLLDNGASINGVDQHGWTALHRAAFKGQLNAVRAILEKGVNIEARDKDGYTAFYCATESGQAEVIKLLLKNRADAEAQTNKGFTALQIANSLHYSRITRILSVHDSVLKDRITHIGADAHMTFSEGRRVSGSIKKRSSRDRVHQSIDWSVPLTVI
ncbi:hypothetical protein IFM89_015023 [Coptis chinensis]|uniref:Uncharacterized protein n=1 Tax=Coptis chinensis TaxID=261450 RepID=A0A835HN14_9MAGN|nr:hypothetical protein IFM89_015023 [Coptis chinensis]